MNIETFSLKFLDVITTSNPKIANGSKETNGRFDDEFKILVGHDQPVTGRYEANDESRINAKFVVIQVGTAGEVNGFAGPDDTWTEVVAIRLNDDGTFNPKGQRIVFRSNGWGPSIYAVEKIGVMTLVPASN